MNSRLNKLRMNLAATSSNIKKRKYEEEEAEPPRKRRFLVRDPQPLQYYGPREADVQSRGRQTRERWSQPPKNYSANNRLINLRHTIKHSKESVEVPNHPPLTSLDKSQSEVASSSTSTHTASSPGLSFNQRNSFVVTAKPSSLQDRLGKMKKSGYFNKLGPQNDQARRSATTNTTGGGWYKSIDVERTRNANQQDRTVTSPKVGANLRLPVPVTTDSRNRSIELFLLNKNSDQHTTATFDDNSAPGFCVDSLPNNVVNDRVLGGSGTSPSAHSDEPSDGGMDWNDFDEKEVVSNLLELRRNNKIASATPQTAFQKALAKEATEIQDNKTLLKTIYIVVDTNIFLSHLETVKKAMKLKINGTSIGVVCPIVLVPWIVIQELDYIKDGKREYKLKNKAQQAIRFINDCLCNKENLKGQSVRDAAHQDFASSNFDDGILYCCLQIREKHNRAILLSNDISLRNKLMNEDFEAYSHEKIFKKLDPYHLSFPKSSSITENNLEEDDKVKSIKTRLSHMCTFIILKELKNAYGDLWNKMGSAKKKLPWSLPDCLDLFEKYWIPVFQMQIPKHCLKHIEMFNKSMRARNGTLSDAGKLLNFGLTLCNHLKSGYACYFETISECIESIEKLYDGNGG